MATYDPRESSVFIFRPRVLALLILAIVVSVVGISYAVGYNPFKDKQIESLKDQWVAVQDGNRQMDQLGKDIATGKVGLSAATSTATKIYTTCQPHEWQYELGYQAALKTINAQDLQSAGLPPVDSVDCHYLPGQTAPAASNTTKK